ncbi:MAG: NAD-dependent epimerase/dehydratase family protein [Cytophagales bacterium]|nr:NAD-dependent epimerase/dehydratase family protein [Cytophagales bacterium]
MKKILVTGGAGFAGSNIAINLKKNYPHYQIYAFDNLKRRGSELNVERFKTYDIQFIHGDIRCTEDIMAVPEVTDIIDACAEPSVLAGIAGDPSYLINTNLNGTVNCLTLAKKYQSNFIFLSTSRVYPIAPLCNIPYADTESRFETDLSKPMQGITAMGINEDFTLKGARSLYGSTKLASELLIEEYHAFFGMNMIINRCGVLTGAWQFGKVDQGFMVLWMANHFYKKKLGYFGFGGTGKQVRDILHIDDLYKLLDMQLHNMPKYNGNIYNVGGGRACSISLAELTKICEEVTGNTILIEKVPETRVADIPIYLSDYTKIYNLCGWKPVHTPQSICADIYHWLHDNEQMLKPLLG